MLNSYSSIHSTLLVNLHNIEMGLCGLNDAEGGEKISGGMTHDIAMWLTMAEIIADELSLDAAAALTNRMSKRLNKGYTYSALYTDVKDLRSRLQDQLTSRVFLFAPENRAKYYKKPSLFGLEVSDKFPKAVDDIEDAATCLALGQGTACVMHLMRVMEVGLKALAKGLKIPYAPSWESYLTQIEARISAKRNLKTAKWKKEEKFYRDISGDLLTIKQAWRNPTMHIERRYDLDEAESILKSVQALMQRMATQLKS